MSSLRNSSIAIPLLVVVAATAAANDEFENFGRPNNCGPVALGTICAYYGVDATILELEELAETRFDGTSVSGMVNAAQKKGLVANAFNSSVSHAKNVQLPVIVDFPKNHFSVLASRSDGAATLLIPPYGVRDVSWSELESKWGGHLIAFENPQADAKEASGLVAWSNRSLLTQYWTMAFFSGLLICLVLLINRSAEGLTNRLAAKLLDVAIPVVSGVAGVGLFKLVRSLFPTAVHTPLSVTCGLSCGFLIAVLAMLVLQGSAEPRDAQGTVGG